MDAGFHELTLAPSGRRYTLYIPEDAVGASGLPLVVSLHYGGQVTPWFGRGLLEGTVVPALRDLNAIMVAPDSTAGGWANPTAERELIELLNYLEEAYDIDEERIVLTGYSIGGIGAWYIAARHQDRFSAAIPMAGRPQPNAAELEWGVPLYAIHSADDELIKLRPTQEAVAALRAQGADVELVVLEGVGHYEAGRYVEPLREAAGWVRRIWRS